MKKNQIKQNPTAYFLQQSSNASDEYRDKINDFVSKLLNLKSCVLCKGEFNFNERIPRILIHCGHTFCQSCLKNFHKNRRVRCPLCLKLIKHIDTLERLPVNHTIFSKMAEELKEKNRREGGNGLQKLEEITQKKFMGPMTAALQKDKKPDENALYNNYMKNVNQVAMQDPKDQQDIEWEYCESHTDRIKHFYCSAHQYLCCRVCKDLEHSERECVVVDLYETEDIQAFLNEMAEVNKDKYYQGYEDDGEIKTTNSV